MNDNEIRQAISRYQFYHIMQLTDDIATPGLPNLVPAQNLCIKHLKSVDMKGKRVLDIGCRDGLFSFLAESMGASETIGIDNDLSKPAIEFLIPFFKSKVKMIQKNLYDLNSESLGLFDVVSFPGVLYHLRYPFWGLKAIREVMNVGGHLIIETAIWRSKPDKALLYCPTGEDGPYVGDPTSCTFFNEKGLTDTLISLGFETIAIEYLETSAYVKLKNLIKSCAERLLPTVPWPYSVTRCVFHCVFRGFDKDHYMARYWEDAHTLHSSGY